MSRNNDVFQVLVTKGNQAVLAADNQVADLAPGQIGVFDYDTNLSIDNTATPRNFYIAVGLDLDGDTVTDDIATSAGSHIQQRNIASYSLRDYEAGQPLKIVLKDYIAECDTEYGIKLELRNQEIYRTQGFNQFTKAYSITTACCDGCTPTCPSGDGNEITKRLKLAINVDQPGLITAEAIARQALTAATHGVAADLAEGAIVSDADLDAVMAFNAAQADPADYVYTDLEITTVSQKINAFCDVNLGYFYPRQTIALMSKISGDHQGFKCTGSVEVSQEAVFEQGAGYDIKQQEYEAKGWSESPYRVSTLNGVADYKIYNADQSANYDQIALMYDEHSKNAWLDYMHGEATYIAVPTADATTKAALLTILNAQVASQGLAAQ